MYRLLKFKKKLKFLLHLNSLRSGVGYFQFDFSNYQSWAQVRQIMYEDQVLKLLKASKLMNKLYLKFCVIDAPSSSLWFAKHYLNQATAKHYYTSFQFNKIIVHDFYLLLLKDLVFKLKRELGISLKKSYWSVLGLETKDQSRYFAADDLRNMVTHCKNLLPENCHSMPKEVCLKYVKNIITYRIKWFYLQ